MLIFYKKNWYIVRDEYQFSISERSIKDIQCTRTSNKSDEYFRITVTDFEGKHALTQAYKV